MAHNFVKTTDKETAERLTQCGFELIMKSGDVYTFANDPTKSVPITFADDLKHFSYSNKLEI